MLVGPGIGERSLNEEQRPREVVPVRLVDRLSRVVLNSVFSPGADVLVLVPFNRPIGLHTEADDGEVGGKDAISVEVVDSRQELSPRQVPRRAEDYEDAGLGD